MSKNYILFLSSVWCKGIFQNNSWRTFCYLIVQYTCTKSMHEPYVVWLFYFLFCEWWMFLLQPDLVFLRISLLSEQRLGDLLLRLLSAMGVFLSNTLFEPSAPFLFFCIDWDLGTTWHISKWSGISQCHICKLQRPFGHFLTPRWAWISTLSSGTSGFVSGKVFSRWQVGHLSSPTFLLPSLSYKQFSHKRCWQDP